VANEVDNLRQWESEKKLWQNEWLSFFFICIINKSIQDQHAVPSLTGTFGDALGQLTVCVAFTYRSKSV
jgi:hypothetical protein